MHILQVQLDECRGSVSVNKMAWAIQNRHCRNFIEHRIPTEWLRCKITAMRIFYIIRPINSPKENEKMHLIEKLKVTSYFELMASCKLTLTTPLSVMKIFSGLMSL